MEKYLKIHWSIRIILGIILSILMLLIINSIYGIIFYRGINDILIFIKEQNIISLEGSIILKMILIGLTMPIILIGLTLQVFILIVIYKVFNYRRWAILLITIFIGLPLLISSFGGIGYIVFAIQQNGLDAIKGDELGFFIFCLCILGMLWLGIKYNIELIRLYKNIKRLDQVDIKLIRNTKPKFLNVFLISIIPIGIFGILMVVLYNPVVPLDIPEGYFKMDGVDLDNPTYTNQEICKNFESGALKMSEKVRYINKEDTNSGVILAKKVLFSYPSDAQFKLKLNKYFTTEELQKEKNLKIAELETYVQNYSEEWNEILIILRSELTEESIIELKKLTESLPQEVNCSIRDNQNTLTEQFSDRMSKYFKIGRLYDTAITLALLENNKKEAIDLLELFHEFNEKYFNANTSLSKGMISIDLLRTEFGSVERIVKKGNVEELQKIQEIYKTPYNIRKNELNSWKGEYYFFEHMLTGRGKSIRQLSTPYILNGEDALNRIAVFYAARIAKINNDTQMLQNIYKNITKYNGMNLVSFQKNHILEIVSDEIIIQDDNLIQLYLDMSYNEIGKDLVIKIEPDGNTYTDKYQEIKLYQDYIRYDLLAIEKK